VVSKVNGLSNQGVEAGLGNELGCPLFDLAKYDPESHGMTAGRGIHVAATIVGISILMLEILGNNLTAGKYA
jgi:hypothetical protein